MKIYTSIIRGISSRVFLWAIVAFFIFEASWIALSFGYPLVYDEAFHFPLIKLFSTQWSPIIFNQPHSADTFGSLTFGASSLYHFLMSIPFRGIVWLFPNNFAAQVVILRLMNVLMVAIGLILFSSLLRLIRIKQLHINIALLLFILIPLVPFCAATTSYDNMLFPLTAVYLILCVKLLYAKNLDWRYLAWIIIVGCLTSLVKIAFLPVFAASVLYLFVFLWRKYGKRFGRVLLDSLASSDRWTIAGLAVLLFIFVALFSLRYIQPVIRYGTPTPDCPQVMPASRCLDYSSQIMISELRTKNERPVESLPNYSTMWFSSSLQTLGRAVAVGPGWGDYQPPLPIINTTLFFMILGGLGILAYAWRGLEKNPGWYFLLTLAVVLLVATFQFNYSLYSRLHYPFAIQPRYLLNFTPIIITMMVVATSYALRRKTGLKLAVLLLGLLLMSQGGGTATYILRGKDFWYWQNDTVLRANHRAKKILEPVIKEN